MHVLFHDVDLDLLGRDKEGFEDIDFSEVLYADGARPVAWPQA